jgi:hypothetical protein
MTNKQKAIKWWGIAAEEPDFDVVKGPLNPREFWFDLRIDAVEPGKEGVYSYQVFVCTPLALISCFDKLAKYLDGRADASSQYMFGKGLLIVREYNIDTILEAVSRELNRLDEYGFDLS